MEQKKVLVVGACGGMGGAVCASLLQNGYMVFGLDRAACCATEGVRYIKSDVTEESSLRAALASVSAETERLYAIVYLAGVYFMDSLLEIDEARMQRIFDVNFFGMYRVNKIFLPLLEPGGRIILTSSELAPLDPLPFNGLYSITKSTVERYAYSLRMEANILGFRVSVLRPGAVQTTLLGDSVSELDAFCEHTMLFRETSRRFRRIVNSVESKSVSPERVAAIVLRALNAKSPKYVYSLNRNLLLRILSALPDRLQVALIGRILRKRNT